MKEATVDFETDAIDKYPNYPPKPVGVAIEFDGKQKYWAWGHPCENNCTVEDAIKVLKYVFAFYNVTFHNAPFDILVAMVHLKLKRPIAFDDTLYLAYLHDPRDRSLALKPLADKYLNMPPDEQTKLKEWILENIRIYKDTKQPVFTRELPNKVNSFGKKTGRDLTGTRKIAPTKWGAYIALAPGSLVGKYAVGDIDRTKKLKKYFLPLIKDAGMMDAYQREINLTYITMDMTDTGTRVAVKRLQKDCDTWQQQSDALDKKIRRKLKCGIDVNLKSDEQLADVLEMSGLVTHWIKTDKGNRSTSRPNLKKVLKDKRLLDMLSLKGSLDTYRDTFGYPWLKIAKLSDGYIHPTFNQTRSNNEYGKGGFGTRTGRMSSSDPNLQNVPDPSKIDLAIEVWARELPFMRDYLIPDVGCIFNGRDYSQQELRLLADFEGGLLYDAYLENPKMDVHEFVGDIITDLTGLTFPRRSIKGVNFGVIYGMGLAALAATIGQGKSDARVLKSAHQRALPAVKELNKILKIAAQRDEPIYTIGGRRYYVEDPREVFNENTKQVETYTYEYKLLNYLIQGSAADVTKQAMIQVAHACTESRLTLQIHDEIILNSNRGVSKIEMNRMREAMEDMSVFDIDIPMLTDGVSSAKSWGAMK